MEGSEHGRKLPGHVDMQSVLVGSACRCESRSVNHIDVSHFLKGFCDNSSAATNTLIRAIC